MSVDVQEIEDPCAVATELETAILALGRARERLLAGEKIQGIMVAWMTVPEGGIVIQAPSDRDAIRAQAVACMLFLFKKTEIFSLDEVGRMADAIRVMTGVDCRLAKAGGKS